MHHTVMCLKVTTYVVNGVETLPFRKVRHLKSFYSLLPEVSTIYFTLSSFRTVINILPIMVSDLFFCRFSHVLTRDNERNILVHAVKSPRPRIPTGSKLPTSLYRTF
jgi:hypothetical protein